MTRLGVTARLATIVLLTSSCGGGGLTSPESRVLPEGFYVMRLTGCHGCSLSQTPGILLDFPDGVDVHFEVRDAGPDEATVEFSNHIGGTFTVEWETVLVGGPGFVARLPYGDGLATYAFRRTQSTVECEFAMLYPGIDFGPAGCTIIS